MHSELLSRQSGFLRYVGYVMLVTALQQNTACFLPEHVTFCFQIKFVNALHVATTFKRI